MENYYKILGLEKDATSDEVDKRYNKLLKEFDPKNQSEDLKEFFTAETEKIKDAYEKISASLSTNESDEKADNNETSSNSTANSNNDEIEKKAKELVEQMMKENKNLNNKKRPTAITVICIIGFIGAFVTVPLIFSDTVKSIGDWYPPYLALTAVIGLTCFIGLWKMKKWAAYTYIGLVAVNQIVLLAMGFWNIGAIAIPGIVICVALSQIHKMD